MSYDQQQQQQQGDWNTDFYPTNYGVGYSDPGYAVNQQPQDDEYENSGFTQSGFYDPGMYSSEFDYSQSQPGYPGNQPGYPSNQPAYLSPSSSSQQYHGTIMHPEPVAQPAAGNPYSEMDDEPPLLEELGINFDHIRQKTFAVLHPLQLPDPTIMHDTDLAGPLVFALMFGGILLLAGKVHFNYIYGIGAMGCMGMCGLLNLMAMTGVSIWVTVSVLGYCLLPMVFLATFGVVISLQGPIGMLLVTTTIGWCSLSASKLFITALAMDHQQPLVAYPCALLYGVFALLSVF